MATVAVWYAFLPLGPHNRLNLSFERGVRSVTSELDLVGDQPDSLDKTPGISEARTAFLSAPGFILGSGLIPPMSLSNASSNPTSLAIAYKTSWLVGQLDGALVFDPTSTTTNGLLSAQAGAQRTGPSSVRW